MRDNARFASALAMVLALALPAAAGEHVSPEDFADYANGYTLYFERDGEPWGSEAFGPDGTVRWRYPSGECLEGVWRGHEGNVCFYYGPGTEVLCWAMRRDQPVTDLTALVKVENTDTTVVCGENFSDGGTDLVETGVVPDLTDRNNVGFT